MGAELSRKREGKSTKTGMSEGQLEDFASKPIKKNLDAKGHIIPHNWTKESGEPMPDMFQADRINKLPQCGRGEYPKLSNKAREEDDLDSKIMGFFKNNPNPEDAQIHQLAESLGMRPDELETKIYSILSSNISKADEDDEELNAPGEPPSGYHNVHKDMSLIIQSMMGNIIEKMDPEDFEGEEGAELQREAASDKNWKPTGDRGMTAAEGKQDEANFYPGRGRPEDATQLRVTSLGTEVPKSAKIKERFVPSIGGVTIQGVGSHSASKPISRTAMPMTGTRKSKDIRNQLLKEIKSITNNIEKEDYGWMAHKRHQETQKLPTWIKENQNDPKVPSWLKSATKPIKKEEEDNVEKGIVDEIQAIGRHYNEGKQAIQAIGRGAKQVKEDYGKVKSALQKKPAMNPMQRGQPAFNIAAGKPVGKPTPAFPAKRKSVSKPKVAGPPPNEVGGEFFAGSLIVKNLGGVEMPGKMPKMPIMKEDGQIEPQKEKVETIGGLIDRVVGLSRKVINDMYPGGKPDYMSDEQWSKITNLYDAPKPKQMEELSTTAAQNPNPTEAKEASNGGQDKIDPYNIKRSPIEEYEDEAHVASPEDMERADRNIEMLTDFPPVREGNIQEYKKRHNIK